MKARLPQGYGGGGQKNMMRQIQKMQEDMAKLQEELEQKEYSATSGGGAVKATVSGKHQLLNLEIDPEVVDPDDIDMLSDLIIAAVNEAFRNAEQNSAEEMSKVTGGLNIPGLSGLF